MKKVLSILLALVLLTGCQKVPQEIPVLETTGETPPTQAEISKTDEEMFTQRDRDASFDGSKAVHITLSGNTATASSDAVRISGATVTVTEEATYLISGELTEGMLVVDAPETAKLQLVFDNVSITSPTSAALYILEADKVFLTLAPGSENTLANGGNFAAIDENNIDGALFSKQDLTLNGSGALTVVSPAGHGIVCKDDLVIAGGSVTVQSASHGLDANDSVRIIDAALSLDAGKDAIHAENQEDTSLGFIYISGGSIQGEAEGDGIAASGWLRMAAGTVNLLVGGGSENAAKSRSDAFGGFMGRPGGGWPGMDQETSAEESGTSMKGMKAGGALGILGGSVTLNCADDAIHSDASVTVSGGTFALASGDDAIHAEDTLTVSAGTIHISECYEGLEALHIQVQGGDITLKASDDGLNAAGGTDQSGITGGRDGMFGGGKGGPGGMGGGRPGGGGFGGMSANSDGSIVISGGTLYIHSSGDGIDANGTLEISGGYTVVVGPTQGDTATLDYDISATITGGTFIGTGAAGMAQTFSDSAQGVIAVSVGNQPAQTRIQLADPSGKTLVDYTPALNFAVVILSCPEMEKGQPYTITVGELSGEFEAS